MPAEVRLMPSASPRYFTKKALTARVNANAVEATPNTA
jgi:hypothetical protein